MPNASLTWNVMYVCRACGNSITIPFAQHFDDCTLADLGADGGTVAVAESPECEVIDEYVDAPSCHNAVMDIADCQLDHLMESAGNDDDCEEGGEEGEEEADGGDDCDSDSEESEDSDENGGDRGDGAHKVVLPIKKSEKSENGETARMGNNGKKSEKEKPLTEEEEAWVAALTKALGLDPDPQAAGPAGGPGQASDGAPTAPNPGEPGQASDGAPTAPNPAAPTGTAPNPGEPGQAPMVDGAPTGLNPAAPTAPNPEDVPCPDFFADDLPLTNPAAPTAPNPDAHEPGPDFFTDDLPLSALAWQGGGPHGTSLMDGSLMDITAASSPYWYCDTCGILPIADGMPGACPGCGA